MKQEQISLRRISSSKNNNNSNSTTRYTRSTSSSSGIPDLPLARRDNYDRQPLALSRVTKTRLGISTFIRSLLQVFTFQTTSYGPGVVPPITCRWFGFPSRVLSLSSSSPTPLGRKVIGTLFGHRKGHVTFAVQDEPRADPALLVELAVSTSALVREMSSGLVRIALECDRAGATGNNYKRRPLFQEPAWTMYLNGRKSGYSSTRECTDFDQHVLSTIQSVSVGAGVIPLVASRAESGSSHSEGELLYMRAKFERVVGSRDSEAFYMLNPDGNGGPELSIFLLRL